MFGIFKKNKPRTALDEVNSITAKMFRPLVNEKDLSDENILQIVQLVMTSFKSAAENRGESISGASLMKIAAKFVKVYDISTPEFFEEHLQYEINLYVAQGLRDDYADN